MSRSVYVKNYPSGFKVVELMELFEEKVGPVDRVDMKDNYAFVIFKEDIAKDAAETLDHHEIDGKELMVQVSRGKEDLKKDQKKVKPSKTLFVLNFDKDNTSEEDLREFFKGCDVEEIEMWRGGKGIPAKNYCFITMKDEDAAEHALTTLDGKFLGDRQVTIQYKQGNRGPRESRRDGDRRGRDLDRRDRRERDYDRRRGDSRDRHYGRDRDRRRDSRDRDVERRRDSRDRDHDRRRDSRDRDYDRRRDSRDRDYDRRRDSRDRDHDRRRDSRDRGHDRRRDSRDRDHDRRERR